MTQVYDGSEKYASVGLEARREEAGSWPTAGSLVLTEEESRTP